MAIHSPGIERALAFQNPCCTVLDVGFSSSIALPCVEGQIITSGARRLNVGGRVLTNLMADRLRLRHFDLTENWLLVEDIQAKLCEVSPDFDTDLRNDYKSVQPRTYVLPDYNKHHRGFL